MTLKEKWIKIKEKYLKLENENEELKEKYYKLREKFLSLQNESKELKEKFVPQKINYCFGSKKILVDFHFDAQFCGSVSKSVILPAEVSNEYIESLFPEVLGMDYDENCWYERHYIIKDDDYKELIARDLELAALECGGVDNWDGCSYAFENYQSMYGQKAEKMDWDEFIEAFIRGEFKNE